MVDRKRLADGLTSDDLPDRAAVEAFVFNTAKAAAPVSPALPMPLAAPRVPLTSKLRADIGHALKRASLERQMAGVQQSQVQEILDAALEPWLREHGYLA